MADDLLAGAAWRVARAVPGAEMPGDSADWLTAVVPGTAAEALRRAGHSGWQSLDYDAWDWWFSTELPANDESLLALRFGGVATVSEIFLDGEQVATSASMYRPFEATIGPASKPRDLTICCRALTPLLAERRPRAPWRSALVEPSNLRFFRTSLLGRMHGGVELPAPVGPFRPVRCEAIRPGTVDRHRLKATVDRAQGRLEVVLNYRLAPSGATEIVAAGTRAPVEIEELADGAIGTATLTIDDVGRWWPRSHGDPLLYDVTVENGGEPEVLGRVGFRSIEVDRDEGRFEVMVNGERVFCRGAVWSPVDPVALAVTPEVLRRALEDLCSGGLNMLRVPGTMWYEDEAFYALCDELGILVWQDCMLANLAPPDDLEHLAELRSEITEVVGPIGSHACCAVICGGSEIEQQAAMSGVERGRWALPVLEEVLPEAVANELGAVTYVSSSPTGGSLPFHNDEGIAHYFGVGAYRRPLGDARRSKVRFASECLAFSTPPEPSVVDETFGGAFVAGHDPRWKAGVPRDAGSSWDFEDITAYYVRALFGVDPVEVRSCDPERYLTLCRAAVATCVEAVFSEWRRAGSGCGGGLVLTARDLVPGAGWGLIDASGKRKASWYALARCSAPVGIGLTDEGLNGLAVHVFNDRAESIAATLRIEAFRDGEVLVERAEAPIECCPRSSRTLKAEQLFLNFVDLTYAYRFGPPSFDAVSVTLWSATGALLDEAVSFPLGLARSIEPELGLSAGYRLGPSGYELVISTRRVAQFVVIDVDNYVAERSWFHLAPGHEQVVALRDGDGAPCGRVSALNLSRAVRVEEWSGAR